MSTLHQAAKAYVAEGYRIIPCRPKTKVPRLEDWLGRALETQEQVDEWYSEHPDDNIAFCPEDMGLAVIDIDPGADLASLDLPEATTTVHTPRGGRHLHFVGSLRPSVGLLTEHVDTRGQRSYALLPPSVTGDGRYEWADTRPAIALPVEIEARLASRHGAVGALTEERDLPANVERGRNRLRALVRRGIVAKSVDYGFGGGDNLAYQVSAELVRDLGLSEQVAIDLLLTEWYPHCIPNNVPEFIIEKVHNVARYGQNEAGAHAVSSEPFDYVVPEDSPSRAKTRFNFLSAAEMMDQPEPEWILPEILQEGTIALLTASKGSFKSFLALDMACGITTGKPTLGIMPAKQGLAFYGAHEGLVSLQKTHRAAWCQYHQINPRADCGLYISEAPRLAQTDDFVAFGEAIQEKAAGRQVRLIVLDTYSACMMGADENDPSDANRFIYQCRALVAGFPGSVLVVPAHFGKDASRGTRGTSALEAGFDTLLTLDRSERDVSLTVVRQRGAPERAKPITLRGQQSLNSLVFLPVDLAALKAAKSAADPFNKSNVAATLMEAGFIASDHTATTAILAALISPQFENEAPARYVARIKETERSLVRLAQSTLAALTFGHGRERRWCFEPTAGFPPQEGYTSATVE